MLHRLTCPDCRHRFSVSGDADLPTATCPECRTTFPVPAAEVVPVAQSSSSRAGRAYADAAGIDLRERHPEGVPSSNVAERLLAEWKALLPEVPSAYKPSGALPAMAVVSLTAGAVAGAPAGVAAGGVVAAIAALVLAIIGGLIALVANLCGVVFCITVVIVIVVALIGIGLTFVAQGMASGYVTAAAGRWGKNRNTGAAAVLGMASAAVGIVLVVAGLTLVEAGPAVVWVGRQFDVDIGVKTGVWIVWGSLIVGGILAVIAAGVTAATLVEGAKFCENCEVYMDEYALRELGWGGTKALGRALAEANHVAAADLLTAPRGAQGKPKLYVCPQCGVGFVELSVHFNATWQEKDEKKDKSVDWLAVSLPMTASEANLYRPHVQSES